jgi:hypothetical protein
VKKKSGRKLSRALVALVVLGVLLWFYLRPPPRPIIEMSGEVFVAERLGLSVGDLSDEIAIRRKLESRLKSTASGAPLVNMSIYLDGMATVTGLSAFRGHIVQFRKQDALAELFAGPGEFSAKESRWDLEVFEPRGEEKSNVLTVEPRYVWFFNPFDETGVVVIPRKVIVSQGTTWRSVSGEANQATGTTKHLQELISGRKAEGSITANVSNSGITDSEMGHEGTVAASSFYTVDISECIARSEPVVVNLADIARSGGNRTLAGWHNGHAQRCMEITPWEVLVHPRGQEGSLTLDWELNSYSVRPGQNGLANTKSPSRALIVTWDAAQSDRLTIRGVQVRGAVMGDLPLVIRLERNPELENDWVLENALGELKLKVGEDGPAIFDLASGENAFAWGGSNLSKLITKDTLAEVDDALLFKGQVVDWHQRIGLALSGGRSEMAEVIREIDAVLGSGPVSTESLEGAAAGLGVKPLWVLASIYLRACAKVLDPASAKTFPWVTSAGQLQSAVAYAATVDDSCADAVAIAAAYCWARHGIELFITSENQMNQWSAFAFQRAAELLLGTQLSAADVTPAAQALGGEIPTSFVGLGGWLPWRKTSSEDGGSTAELPFFRGPQGVAGLIDLQTKGSSHGLYLPFVEYYPLRSEVGDLHLSWDWSVTHATVEPGGTMVTVGGKTEGPKFNHPIQLVAIVIDRTVKSVDPTAKFEFDALHYGVSLSPDEVDYNVDHEYWLGERVHVRMPSHVLLRLDAGGATGPQTFVAQEDFGDESRNLAMDLERAAAESGESCDPSSMRLAIVGIIANAQYKPDGTLTDEEVAAAATWYASARNLRLEYK